MRFCCAPYLNFPRRIFESLQSRGRTSCRLIKLVGGANASRNFHPKVQWLVNNYRIRRSPPRPPAGMAREVGFGPHLGEAGGGPLKVVRSNAFGVERTGLRRRRCDQADAVVVE